MGLLSRLITAEESHSTPPPVRKGYETASRLRQAPDGHK
jgi:hypothetical protein